MNVGDVMTRNVVTCRPDADIAAAARLMLDGRFGALPVIDPHGLVAGIITDRDIAIAAGTRQRNASHIGVHEAMTHKVWSCYATDGVGAALKQMEAARVRRLPVLDANSHLAGILSIDDIIQRALGRAGGVSAADVARSLQRICSTPAIEPETSASPAFAAS